jgi:hypothetical protein
MVYDAVRLDLSGEFSASILMVVHKKNLQLLSRRRIPEDFNLHQQRCENIQSRTRSTAPFGIHIKSGEVPYQKYQPKKRRCRFQTQITAEICRTVVEN